MPKKSSTATNNLSSLPTFITLSEAAHRMGLSVNALHDLIRGGTLKAIQYEGEFLVNAEAVDQAKEETRTKEQIIQEKYPNLIGVGVTLSEAAKQFDVPLATVRSWLYVSKYLRVLEDSYPLKVDAAEVAYLAGIYKSYKIKGIVGAPLVDENGLPYELKHPKLSEYRKKKKKRPPTNGSSK